MSPRLRLAGELQFGSGALLALVALMKREYAAALVFLGLWVIAYLGLSYKFRHNPVAWWVSAFLITALWLTGVVGVLFVPKP
jgi:hypothetical protein